MTGSDYPKMDYATAISMIDYKPALPPALMYILSRYTIDEPVQVTLGTLGCKLVIFHHPQVLALTLKLASVKNLCVAREIGLTDQFNDILAPWIREYEIMHPYAKLDRADAQVEELRGLLMDYMSQPDVVTGTMAGAPRTGRVTFLP